VDSLEAVRVFLQASPDELRAVLDLAPIGIVVLRGPELVYEYVNTAYQSFAPTVQLIGRRFADASWELPDVLVKLKEVWETGQPWRVTDYMIPIERHPGAPLEQASFTVSCTRVGRRDASDALVGFVYETTDRVDAMERATSAMAEAERRTDELETIIATMLEGVLVIDRGRKVTLVNPAARRMLADFSGMEVHDREQAQRALREIDGRYLDGRPVENHMIPVARALAGEACRSTFRFRNPIDRHTIYASIGAAPIRNQEGEVVGAVSVGSDVTEEIELDRLKDEFIRQIAHEVKTPITIMKGCASVRRSRRLTRACWTR
jgi:PAS domain-containing protein